MELGKPQMNPIYSSLYVILKRCKYKRPIFKDFNSLHYWADIESRLLLILRSMDAGYLPILRTNDFRCVFRYFYGVNASTAFKAQFTFNTTLNIGL